MGKYAKETANDKIHFADNRIRAANDTNNNVNNRTLTIIVSAFFMPLEFLYIAYCTIFTPLKLYFNNPYADTNK